MLFFHIFFLLFFKNKKEASASLFSNQKLLKEIIPERERERERERE
jgi:hypothetical protein